MADDTDNPYAGLAILKIEGRISRFDDRNMVDEAAAEAQARAYEADFNAALSQMPEEPGVYWVRYDKEGRYGPAAYGLKFYYGKPGWYFIGDECPSDIVGIVVGPRLVPPDGIEMAPIEGLFE